MAENTGWDASTIAAVAALVVACLAFLVASAQVLQQYFITGQLIRLCDSVVYGPLPGQGRRVWQFSQFRFRVLYSIPNISLDTELWPSVSPHVKSYATGQHSFPSLTGHGVDHVDEKSIYSSGSVHGFTDTAAPSQRASHRSWTRPKFNFWNNGEGDSTSRSSLKGHDVGPGEASWVSFCRATELHCGQSMRIDFSVHDADRCPIDLPTAPMQVSMRDIVVMGLMAGMEVTQCSFSEKSVSMQGEIGTITSASHSVLGPILHFAPRIVHLPRPGAFGVSRSDDRGEVDARWISRTWGTCTVANKYYNDKTRRKARRLDERWLEDRKGERYFDIVLPDGGTPSRRPRNDRSGRQSEGATEGKAQHKNLSKDTFRAQHRPQRYDQDGNWTIARIPEQPTLRGGMQNATTQEKEPSIKDASNSSKSHPRRPSRRATVEDYPEEEDEHDHDSQAKGPAWTATVEDEPGADDSELPAGTPPVTTKRISSEMAVGVNLEGSDRAQIALAKQAERREKLKAIERDKGLVKHSISRGAMTSPYQPRQQLLLTNAPHNDEDVKKDEDRAGPTTAEEDARRRETKRFGQREQREKERKERQLLGDRVASMTGMDMFWFCQVDIYQGFWATEWPRTQGTPLQAALVGGITVVLECLLGFLPNDALTYTGASAQTLASFQRTAANWLFLGYISYPAYALNARGGTIANGFYREVLVPAFGSVPIPALELLYSYEWQVDSNTRDAKSHAEELNVELMRLDSWLSYVGRMEEIADGPKRMLKRTPGLIAVLMEEFEHDFQYIDLSTMEGGLQAIQNQCAIVMDWMMDEDLTEQEQLYLLVALLRAFKVAQCVHVGADTKDLYSILTKDIQVHLV